MDFKELQQKRLESWGQDGAHFVEGPGQARPFIERTGICTHYPVSPEIANLFHGFLSDPTAKTDPGWDTPSGEVYTWRWKLGAEDAAFYGLVGKRPTWIAWDLLPFVLGALMDRRAPADLFEAGLISREALTISEALGSNEMLSTKELRIIAGFPKGKESRAAYTKALEELENRLIVGKKLGGGEGEDMYHSVVSVRHRDAVEASAKRSHEEAILGIALGYLKTARYLRPKPFEKFFRFAKGELEAALTLGLDTNALDLAADDAGEVIWIQKEK